MATEPRPTTEATPVDRQSAAAVFARAAELDVAWATTNGADDGLDEDELLQIGTNAGLSPAALSQAVAELRGGALVPAERPTGPGTIAIREGDLTWVGPRGVIAQRAVPMPPRRARAAAERFLREQLFEKSRDNGGRTTWRRRDTLSASAQRHVARIFRKLDLDGVVDPVVLAVVAEPGSDGQRSIVRFEADLAPTRAGIGTGIAGAAVVAGVAAGGIAFVPWEAVGVLLSLPAAGATAGGGVAVGRRSYRRHHDRAATCLEAFLDRLEHGRP